MTLSGFGLGLRHKHFDHIIQNNPKIDWFEALSENYLATEGLAKEALYIIARKYPIVLHGVSMSIGSSDPINKVYLKKLKKLSEDIDARMISDHLCWTGVHGNNTHDLLPLPFTQESLDHCINRVKEIQDYLGRQIYIENPSSYFSYEDSTIYEWDFLSRLAFNSGAGIVLDINNIFVSAHNHGFSAREYIQSIDPKIVGYIHLAGHTAKNDYILDSHVGPVPQGVWELFRYGTGKLGKKPTMIEWDDEIPEFDILEREVKKIKHYRAMGSAKTNRNQGEMGL